VHTYGHIDLSNLQLEGNYGSFRAYANSKLANILFTRALARRVAGTGVTVNCLHPGAVATALFRRLPRILEKLIKVLTLSPERGARTSVYLASSGEVARVTGKYFVRCREAPISKEAGDDKLGEALWQISEELTGNGDSGEDGGR
jgi:NAD(P)-dependent dehydrogenase (short-subunit alcohol dehydrogenase family)